jgi:hypothetical protein
MWRETTNVCREKQPINVERKTINKCREKQPKNVERNYQCMYVLVVSLYIY